MESTRIEVEFQVQLERSKHFECKLTLQSHYQKACADILECLNEAEMTTLKETTQFGHIISSAKDYNLSSQIMWYMMIRQSHLTMSDELWMVVNDRPLRFSKFEYALLTGLDCSSKKPEFPESDEFSRKYFGGETSVTVNQVLRMMQSIKERKRNKESMSLQLVQMASLYFVAAVLWLSWQKMGKVDSILLSLASDWEIFKSYPWGTLAYQAVCKNFKKDLIKKEQKIRNEGVSRTYNVGGFVHPLQVLAYECIPGIARKYAEKKQGDALPLPRMCRWTTRKWSMKSCPKYTAVDVAVNESADIICCLTPTQEEAAAPYIISGDFHDTCPNPVTSHIAQLVSQRKQVYCKISPPQQSFPSHAVQTKSRYCSPSPFQRVQDKLHGTPINSPSPSHSTSPKESAEQPSVVEAAAEQLKVEQPRAGSAPPTEQAPAFDELAQLRAHIDKKFELLEKQQVRILDEQTKIAAMMQKLYDHAFIRPSPTEPAREETATIPLKRPKTTSSKVVKRRKYIDIYEEAKSPQRHNPTSSIPQGSTSLQCPNANKCI